MKDNFKLDQLPKHNIYQVPENYFERLPMRVMERTAAAREKAERTEVIWRPIRMVMAPLVLLLVFLGVFYFNVPTKPETGYKDLAALQDQEIVEYLAAYATLESTDFAELNTLEEQELTADFLNVSPTSAEEELEFYHIKNIDY